MIAGYTRGFRGARDYLFQMKMNVLDNLFESLRLRHLFTKPLI